MMMVKQMVSATEETTTTILMMTMMVMRDTAATTTFPAAAMEDQALDQQIRDLPQDLTQVREMVTATTTRRKKTTMTTTAYSCPVLRVGTTHRAKTPVLPRLHPKLAVDSLTPVLEARELPMRGPVRSLQQ